MSGLSICQISLRYSSSRVLPSAKTGNFLVWVVVIGIWRLLEEVFIERGSNSTGLKLISSESGVSAQFVGVELLARNSDCAFCQSSSLTSNRLWLLRSSSLWVSKTCLNCSSWYDSFMTSKLSWSSDVTERVGVLAPKG